MVNFFKTKQARTRTMRTVIILSFRSKLQNHDDIKMET